MVVLNSRPVFSDWESYTHVHWDTPGMKVVGKLIAIHQGLLKDRLVKEAAVQTADGTKKFYLTTDLKR